jgi:acyl-CoA synthetase (AMP-forming)/AMP-acid ligase II
VTYQEISSQIQSAASALREHLRPGDRVAVVIENSPEYLAACYGIWMAGGAIVGLNPALKGEKLAGLVAHSGARVLIIDARHPELATLSERIGPSVKKLEVKIGEGLGPGAGRVDPPDLDPGSLAAIVYTSGTTGHPKGVMLSHRNLAANTESILRSLPIEENDRALCALPFQYSYGASILHTHLVRGATVVLERSFLFPHLVLDRMVQERATTLAGVSSTFHLLMRRADLTSYDLSSLRYVTSAGGPMGLAEVRRFQSLVPGVEFFVMYGQTEAAPRLTCLPAEDLGRKPGSAGKAIQGVELKIRDEEGRDLLSGEIGEVSARGDNVMMGYWGDPQETEQVLRDGWLWTGDLGHLDEDGYLFLQGRRREMIKSGSHRISPTEIEEVILDLPGVRDVAVAGVKDDLLGEVPHAWVVTSEPGPALRKRILHECQSRLARFQVPREVVFCEGLPRTASGKVQKHLLVTENESKNAWQT